MTFERNYPLLYGWQQLWRENVVFKIISCTARIFILLIKRNLMIYLLFYVQLKICIGLQIFKKHCYYFFSRFGRHLCQKETQNQIPARQDMCSIFVYLRNFFFSICVQMNMEKINRIRKQFLWLTFISFFSPLDKLQTKQSQKEEWNFEFCSAFWKRNAYAPFKGLIFFPISLKRFMGKNIFAEQSRVDFLLKADSRNFTGLFMLLLKEVSSEYICIR